MMGLIHSWLLQFCLSFIPSVGHSFPHCFSFRSWCKVCLNLCFAVWATLLLLSGLALTLNIPISTSSLGWMTKQKCFIYLTPLLFSCFKPSNSSFTEKKQKRLTSHIIQIRNSEWWIANRGSISLSFALRPLFTTLALQKDLKVRESAYFEVLFSWQIGGRELIINKSKNSKQTNNLKRKIIQTVYKYAWTISEWLLIIVGKQIKQLYYTSHLSLVISPTLTKQSNSRQSLKAKKTRLIVKGMKLHNIWIWHFYNYSKHWYLWSALMHIVYIEKQTICYILYTDSEVRDQDVPSFCLIRGSEGAGLRELLRILYRSMFW